MNSQKLRIGIIGSGQFARECHIPCLQSHPNVEIVAICGRSATKLALQFGIESVMDKYEELCTRNDIDAITIASANQDHAAHSIAALTGKKHVFCEKPLALTVQDANTMTLLAKKTNKVNFVGFTFRYNHGVQDMKKRIGNGEIGKPFLARIQYDRWDGLIKNLDRANSGHAQYHKPGMLLNLGSHLFDILRYVLGPIDTVIGHTHSIQQTKGEEAKTIVDINPIDDLAGAWIKHKNGVFAQFFISQVTPSFAELGFLEIIGENGALKAALSRGSVDSIKLSTPWSPEWSELTLPELSNPNEPHALKRMMHHYVDACLRNKMNENIDATFEDGRQAQLAMAALIDSQSSGSWTKLSL